jgi:hypothetical protein
MKLIERQLKQSLLRQWDSGKVLIVLGPRQAGKTTLIENICKEKGAFLFLNGDDPEIRTVLENACPHFSTYHWWDMIQELFLVTNAKFQIVW